MADLEVRFCACGCGIVFRCMKTSPQQYASTVHEQEHLTRGTLPIKYKRVHIIRKGSPENAMVPPDGYHTARMVGEHFHVPQSRISRLKEQGKLHTHAVEGYKWEFFKLNEVQKYFESITKLKCKLTKRLNAEVRIVVEQRLKQINHLYQEGKYKEACDMLLEMV